MVLGPMATALGVGRTDGWGERGLCSARGGTAPWKWVKKIRKKKKKGLQQAAVRPCRFPALVSWDEQHRRRHVNDVRCFISCLRFVINTCGTGNVTSIPELLKHVLETAHRPKRRLLPARAPVFPTIKCCYLWENALLAYRRRQTPFFVDRFPARARHR